MNKTERLYYANSHLAEFDAQVIAVTDTETGQKAVTLDRTAFYPTGGGQPNDTGILAHARVVDCVDAEEAGVLHIIEGPVPEVGARVNCVVDWSRRLDHIQQHTGQHILSQAFIELFNAQTRGFRMMERASEIDVELSEPTDERIEQAVELANSIVWEDRPVRIHNVTAEEAMRLPLRKDSVREGELRIIEIEGFDMSPCGGTHAQRTGEIGMIAVRSWERAKGLTRIEFVAGGRALADYRSVNSTARSVAAMFSVGRDEIAVSVTRLIEENKRLMRRTRALEEIATRVEADEMLNEAVRRGDGVRVVTRVFEDRDADSLKRIAQQLIAHQGTIALLGSHDGDSARLVFARAAGASGDMNALMREASAKLNGRGGGRMDMAQGGGQGSVEKLKEIIESVARSQS